MALPVRLVVPALAVVLLGLAACTTSGGNPTSSGPLTPAPSSGRSDSGSTEPSRSPGGASATPSPSPSSTATPVGPQPTDCAGLLGELSLSERVGQLLMVSVSSTGLTSSRATMIGRTHAGSVLLLGNSKAGMSATQQVVADVRGAADRPQRVNVVLAADQEGGLVQRLAGSGFSDIPSAFRQAELPDAELADEAETWGEELDKAGINLNLAPVADVVPRSLVSVNQPISQLRRGYGSSPTVVARKVAAFTTGMDNAGLATAVKHFPGLGQVRGNTDTEARVVDGATTRKDPALAGFSAAVKAGVDMVMVSSATYTKIDAKQQAVFSSTVIDQMIRGDLGFDGVVISDDLAAKGVSNVSGPQRAVRFVKAGGDLIIVADPSLAQSMAKTLVARAKSDPDFAARIDESAARVLAFKARRGLARC
ncbi:glycoside hydrolase family 3 N-terminal domain-containing protein [uncultured Friedmanniella sp.]|uniref:glycoside hydrolase family 3 N-terminal domain-containing protein n=1 Tax=uncultured Friedmanniella sp. TaxID=335381 RepID=UPI0035CAEF39